MAQTRTTTKQKVELSYPKRYNVIIHNDNQTPIDFVITLLVELFNKTLEDARSITMTIHEEGQAVVGTYNREIAEQKTAESNNTARFAGYPLKTTFKEV